MSALAGNLLATHLVQAQTSRVYFTEPKDGAVVTSPVTVKFMVEGKKIGALGDMNPALGHHHLIINGPALSQTIQIEVRAKEGMTTGALTAPPLLGGFSDARRPAQSARL